MNKIVIFCLAVFFTSCLQKFETPPKDILPENVMREIYIDMHIQEAIIMQANLQGDSAIAAYMEAKNYVLKSHKVDTALFRKSQDFYINHINNYKRIYEGVVDTLALREQRGLLKRNAYEKLSK